MLLSSSLFCLFLLAGCTQASAKSDVIDLSDKNFNDVVLKSELPFMVEFFAPWCGHCKALTPEWEKAATNLKGILPIGKVDCTVHQGLCSRYGVQGYPTIKCFHGKKTLDYQQARQASAIIKYATDQLPDQVARVKDTASLEKYLEKTPEKPHVLLFSAKAEVSPLVKSLAVKFASKVLVGQIKKGVTEIESKYNVENFPTVIAITSDNVAKFEGTISPDSLSSWIASVAGDGAPASSSEPAAEEAPKPKPKPKPKVDSSKFTESTAAKLSEVCTPSLCVVAFVETSGEAESHAVKPEHNAVLTQVLEKWSKDGKFQFVWVDRSSASEFATSFALPEGPSFVVYNAKRSKFARADFDASSAHVLLEHVNAGDVKYQTIAK